MGHIVMARHGFLLLALALLLGVCLGSAVRAEPVDDAASSTQSESASAEEEKEADVQSSAEAASHSQEQASSGDVEKQPSAEDQQSSGEAEASASTASEQSAESAASASDQVEEQPSASDTASAEKTDGASASAASKSAPAEKTDESSASSENQEASEDKPATASDEKEEQPSASDSASAEKTDGASASAASESASSEKTDESSASSENQEASEDKPATEDSSASSEGKTDASDEKEDSDSSSSKAEQSTKKKADAGATKLALGKTALPIAHPNGMPASIVNTAFGPTLGTAAHLNGKKYGIVGEGLNAHAVPMTDTFPSASGRVTINPVNPKLQQIAPAPVMGSGIGATPCSGAACSGMTSVPVGQKIVHDMKVTNVPGVPQAEVAVAAPGTPTMRQGKMTRTAGDVTLPPVVPAVPEGTDKLGLVSNSDGTSKLVVPSINGHLREVPGLASAIDPTIKDLGVYGNQTTGHFAGIAVPGPSHEDSQGDPEKDFSQTPVRSQGGRIVAVPDESLDGGAAALGVMGHGDNAKLVAIPDTDPSDLAQAAKAVSHEGSKYARTVYVPGAPSAAPMKDIPITMIGEKFFAIPGIKRDNGKTKMEVVGTGDNAHVVAVPDGDLTQAPQGFITNDSNAHVLALPSANGGNARVVTVGDTFADGTPVMGAGTTLAIMGERGSQRVVMLPKGGSDLAFAQNGSVAALPDHMQPGDPLSVFKMVTGSGDKGKMVAMPGTGLAAMHDGTELALVAEGKDARVVVVPKKQSNTFGRSGSITSILTAKYSLNSTRSIVNKLEAEIKKEGLTEGPKFPLPDSLQGATVLGYGHKMSYTGMDSISHFCSPQRAACHAPLMHAHALLLWLCAVRSWAQPDGSHPDGSFELQCSHL